MTTIGALTNCVKQVVNEGYRECFKVTARGLYATSRSRYYRPEQVQVVNTYRFDAQADPRDDAVMYVIETSDGIKGTLIDAYGSYADGSIGRFVAESEEIRRKMARHDNRNFC